MGYPPHGEYQLERRGTIMFGRFRGAWNAEGVRAMLQEYMDLSEPLRDAPWAGLHDHRGLHGSPPDAIGLLHEGLILGHERNLRVAALVVDDSDLARDLLARIYLGTGVDFDFFLDPDAALEWLTQQGYTEETQS